jgi:hypothetical protein
MKPTWQTPVTYFVLFNLLGAPLIGRGVWLVMQGLNAEGDRIAAVAVSLLAPIGILAVNALLTVWATREGLAKRGRAILWIITAGTFLLPIGFGTFSPVNLIIAAIRAAAI